MTFKKKVDSCPFQVPCDQVKYSLVEFYQTLWFGRTFGRTDGFYFKSYDRTCHWFIQLWFLGTFWWMWRNLRTFTRIILSITYWCHCLCQTITYYKKIKHSSNSPDQICKHNNHFVHTLSNFAPAGHPWISTKTAQNVDFDPHPHKFDPMTCKILKKPRHNTLHIK